MKKFNKNNMKYAALGGGFLLFELILMVAEIVSGGLPDKRSLILPSARKYRENYETTSNIAKSFTEKDISYTLDNQYGKYLSEIGFEIDYNKVKETNVNDVDMENINEFIFFKYPETEFRVKEIQKFEKLGRVIAWVYPSNIITDFSYFKPVFIIIDGFMTNKDSNHINNKNILKNLNSFKITNNELNQSSFANGIFIDYEINNDGYPTKWYFLTNIHPLDIFSNKNNYELTNQYLNANFEYDSEFYLSNNGEFHRIENPRIVFMGFDVFKSDLSYLSFEKNQEIEDMLDVCVLEVDFKNQEEARKFTSISELDKYRWFSNNNLNFKAFEELSTQTDLFNLEENTIVKVSGKTNIHILQNKENLSTNLMVYNNLISKNQVLNVNNKKYLDITTSLGFSQTSYGLGSSGSVIYKDNFVALKTGDYRNSEIGLYTPLQWDNIQEFKNDIVDKLSNLKIFNLLNLESYDLIYGNKQTQKNWYLKSLKQIKPNIKTYLSMKEDKND